MASINKAFLLGRLGAEPQLKSFPSGDFIVTFSIATSEKWTDKRTGEPKEVTEWHKIVLRNFLAELAIRNLHKGSQVYIEGAVKTRKWTDDYGISHYITEIQAERLELIDLLTQKSHLTN